MEIKDHKLNRDMDSKALKNTDTEGLRKYQERMMLAVTNKKQAIEIKDLKSEIAEIKKHLGI